jgi:hypothetical protein
MARRDGHWCCECDYCARGVCVGPAYTIGFVGHGHYIQFCVNHVGQAAVDTLLFLRQHPGVSIDWDDTDLPDEARA